MLVPLFRSPIRVIDSSERPALAALDGGPPPVPGGRPKGCKRLHTNATVAHVRRLIEDTSLTYKQIEAKTGVSQGTVGRWARDGGWTRHPLAPKASDTVPTARAGRRLKLRMLGVKLHQLAERCVDELWQAPSVDLDRLIEAMQVLNMARLTLKGRRGPPRDPGPARTGQQWLDRDAALRKTLIQLRYGGVKLDRIPEAAMVLLEDAHTPPERGPPRGPRRRR
ncbi:hypothetical protein SR870_11090 [Rhodopseudomonas palustris]|uniref:hypothetical protein n=1 Tax=Rhodopseudomonas palustris TaxID=1076 RepID=UPI002ACD9980|nr:hypothetical protein [Rhodopseudomonas palustris]WQH01779.1 hypothetical protein SR870_11090 [Rhodopseudomonas palustris]